MRIVPYVIALCAVWCTTPSKAAVEWSWSYGSPPTVVAPTDKVYVPITIFNSPTSTGPLLGSTLGGAGSNFPSGFQYNFNFGRDISFPWAPFLQEFRSIALAPGQSYTSTWATLTPNCSVATGVYGFDPLRPDTLTYGGVLRNPTNTFNFSVAPVPGFTQLVSNSWSPTTSVGNSINRRFSPNVASLPGSSLSDLAALGGFDHFNVEQVITRISGNILPLPRSTGVDPAIGGNPGQYDDVFPWYFNETYDPRNHVWMFNDTNVLSTTSFSWGDRPNLNLGSFPSGWLYTGTVIEFTDYLVGVHADHTGVRVSELYPSATNVNFKWKFTQGLWGGRSFEIASTGPPDPGSDGSIDFLGYFGNNPDVLSPISAVPERPSIDLMIVGLLSMFALQRRKQRAQ